MYYTTYDTVVLVKENNIYGLHKSGAFSLILLKC